MKFVLIYNYGQIGSPFISLLTLGYLISGNSSVIRATAL